MVSEISKKKQTEAFASLQHEHRFLLPGDVNVAVSTCPIIHIRVQDGATPQL